jgi:putative methyltransferase
MASHYREAAKCLKAVDGGRTTLKTAAYKTQNPPRTVALVSEARRHRRALETAIAATGLRTKAGGDNSMLLLAVYDAVAGTSAPKCGGKMMKAIREALPALKAVFAAARTAPEQPKVEKLRYLRCNLLTTSRKEARAKLEALGIHADEDEDLDDLLVTRATVHGGHAMVLSGELVLQDKSSCFPAHALLDGLAPDWRGDVVDACAAPGNKTTHCAALLRGRGQVVAVDRDPKRLKVLESRVEEARACDVVTPTCGDFLRMRHDEARCILVDPSCSGGFETDGESLTSERLAGLAAFQGKILEAALTRFPRAERVSYSTCSIHEEEDEAVVARALASPEVQAGGWRLAPALPAWARRSRPHVGLDLAQSDCLARAEPAADRTGAFFVALFERAAPGGAARKRRRG